MHELQELPTHNGTILKYIGYDKALPLPNLGQILNTREQEQLARLKNLKRKNEFIYTRMLWKSFGISEDINYDCKGRPELKSSGFISISHSRNIVAIAWHPTHPVGIDVEFKAPKLSLIRKKFLSAGELEAITEADLEATTVAWSIKEAVYKMENIEGLSLRENIYVTIQPNEVFASVIKGKEIHHYTFRYRNMGEFVISWCSHEDINGTSIF